MEAAMEPVANDLWGLLLSWLPAALLLAATALLPTLLLRTTRSLRKRLYEYLPEWMRILLEGYEKPLAEMLRLLCLVGMLMALPLGFNTTVYRSMILKLLGVALVLLVTWGGWRSAPVCRLLLRSAENRLDMETNRTMARFFENIFRVIVVLLGSSMALDLVGVPVTGLLTGAGVAGLAVSLAAQSTLSNLIAGITLVVEHPFGIGDYVMLGSYEGTVEDISFRSTRLRTPDNVVITVENSKICAEYIQNVTARTSRLWQFTIGLTYNTAPDTVDRLRKDLIELLAENPHIDAENLQVYLSEFADSSINVTVRAYADTLALADFNRLKSNVNVQIMRLMQADGCSFAFPSTSVYLEPNQK